MVSGQDVWLGLGVAELLARLGGDGVMGDVIGRGRGTAPAESFGFLYHL